MNTKFAIAAVAATVLATLAVPGIASAQAAMFLPSTYSWNQVDTTGIPADARNSVTAPTRHHVPHTVQPYGQW
jgi:hypothetical protein